MKICGQCPHAVAQPKFGSKNLRFFLPFPELCPNTPEKHTGHLPSTNFAKKAILVLEVFVRKLGKLGRVAGHVAACRSMSRHFWHASLGMSQHVAACRGDFCARRWACRSMSLHFSHLSLGMSQHFVPLLGVLRHFAGVWANFWPKSQFSGLASAPPCFSDSLRAQTSGGFSVFFQRGIGLKEGDSTLQRELKIFSAVAL